MRSTRVLYTNMPPGMNEIAVTCSYLKKQFFIENPTEKPERIVAEEITALSGTNDDDFQRVKVSEEDVNAEEDYEDEDDEGKELQQVEIKMLKVSWLLRTSEGKKLVANMVNKEDCLELFKTGTVKIFVDYLWDTTKSYFLYIYFLPFILLGFVPLLVMAFMM